MASSRADVPPTPSRASSPMVTCDLCEAPMAYPTHLIGKPLILGLLTCSQCVEDNLANREMELIP